MAWFVLELIKLNVAGSFWKFFEGIAFINGVSCPSSRGYKSSVLEILVLLV